MRAVRNGSVSFRFVACVCVEGFGSIPSAGGKMYKSSMALSKKQVRRKKDEAYTKGSEAKPCSFVPTCGHSEG